MTDFITDNSNLTIYEHNNKIHISITEDISEDTASIVLDSKKTESLKQWFQSESWISVDERLPEPQNFYRPIDFIRFICSDGYVYDGFYYRHYGEDGEFDEGFNVCSLLAENGKWCVDEREILHSGDTITHWRPLPEPPEGDE